LRLPAIGGAHSHSSLRPPARAAREARVNGLSAPYAPPGLHPAFWRDRSQSRLVIDYR